MIVCTQVCDGMGCRVTAFELLVSRGRKLPLAFLVLFERKRGRECAGGVVCVGVCV